MCIGPDVWTLYLRRTWHRRWHVKHKGHITYNIEMVGCALRRRHVHRWYEAHDIALRKRVRRLAANLNRISEDIQPVRRISIWMVLQQTVCHRNTSIRKSNAWGNYKYARTKWPLKNIDKNEEEVGTSIMFTSAIWFSIDVECVLWPHDRTLSRLPLWRCSLLIFITGRHSH